MSERKLRESLEVTAATAVGDPLVARFDMFVKMVRDVRDVDDPVVGAFAQGFRKALVEADRLLAPPEPDAWRARWEFQIKGGSDEWHPYSVTLPEREARHLVSKDYPVPIRRNVVLEARVDGVWKIMQEGETECASS